MRFYVSLWDLFIGVFIYSAHGQSVGIKIDNRLVAVQRIHKGLFLGAARCGRFAVKDGQHHIGTVNDPPVGQ